MIPIPSSKAVQDTLDLDQEPQFIDSGGFKVVYRLGTPSGQEVLKAVYIPSSVGEEEDIARAQLIARAEREIVALGECKSPHLVKLGGFPPTIHSIEDNDYLVYSEEYLPGQTLSNWINRDPAPIFRELLGVFSSLISLIRNLSEAGYLHRDIKPANIIDTGLQNRPYVLLDLGIAYKIHGTELTLGGSPPGTLRYMAPELLKPDYKNVMDFRCDLYAAGLTVYVVASGIHPFAPKPEHDYATAYRILKERPQALALLRPDLPPAFCGIIDRCIRKKPALRYARLDLIEDALQEVRL